MDWNIIIPIGIFISDIILAWFCYKLGCRTVKPIEDKNNEIEIYKKELEDNISYLKDEEAELKYQNKCLDEKFEQTTKELIHAEEKRKLLDGENKKTLDFIQQSEQLAKEKAQAIYENELAEWNKRFKVVQEYQSEYLNKLEEDIYKVENELKSLKDTKAAAIAAAQKEKEIKENKDDYCLILPIEEANDITILRGVIRKITKPRAILMAIWQAYYQPIAKKKFPQILGKADVCGIYKITNQQTGECYIGQARDCKKRWYEHCRCGIGIDTPQGSQLYSAMLEYGLDAFSFELLLECDPSQLNEKEKYFIELYNSNIVGYNINKGAN